MTGRSIAASGSIRPVAGWRAPTTRILGRYLTSIYSLSIDLAAARRGALFETFWLMRYIRIDRRSLKVEVVNAKDAKDAKSVFVPVKSDRYGSALTDMLHYVVYFDVLYPIVEAADRKRGVIIKHRLYEPDPWLIALAAIMWEGLVQGLTWDTIKMLSLAALGRLREKRLAPQASSIAKAKRQKRSSRTEVGFSWTQYNTDGRPLYQFFLGVKRRFGK